MRRLSKILYYGPSNLSKDVREGDLKYEELKVLVNERKILAKNSFNRSDTIFSNYRSTVLYLIIFDSKFYLSLLVYVAVRYTYIENTTMPTLQIVPVGYIGSLVSFLVVFFASQVYTRYLNLYNFSMVLEGRIFDTILLAKTLLSPSVAMRIFRYINAAHILCYIGFADVYKVHNLLEPLNNQYYLLDSAEISRLNTIGFNGGSTCREVLVWVSQVINQQHVKGKINKVEQQMLLDQILRFRAAVGSLYDYEDMPFPFIYINFLNFITLVYPALFALATARYFTVSSVKGDIVAELLGGLCVFLHSMFIIGLRKIADHFHQPYGNHLEDLNVVHFLEFTIQASRKLLFARQFEEVDDVLEIEMDKYRPPIGNGFMKQAEIKPRQEQETLNELPTWSVIHSAIHRGSFRQNITSEHINQYVAQQTAKAEEENLQLKQTGVALSPAARLRKMKSAILFTQKSRKFTLESDTQQQPPSPSPSPISSSAPPPFLQLKSKGSLQSLVKKSLHDKSESKRNMNPAVVESHDGQSSTSSVSPSQPPSQAAYPYNSPARMSSLTAHNKVFTTHVEDMEEGE